MASGLILIQRSLCVCEGGGGGVSIMGGVSRQPHSKHITCRQREEVRAGLAHLLVEDKAVQEAEDED